MQKASISLKQKYTGYYVCNSIITYLRPAYIGRVPLVGEILKRHLKCGYFRLPNIYLSASFFRAPLVKNLKQSPVPLLLGCVTAWE
jgi:hypothetical protein